ncbi:MAG: SIS domain-containing protein [Oscillospiraceae bacterium]|nr:SIS domain-containing protein [Oscillospiraceae bacterium]
METAVRYFAHAQNKLQQVLAHEMPNIKIAADYVSESCKNGGKFYVFGSGHSHMIAEELYLRAGGLALVHGILPPELMLHEMANKSTYLERVEGYSQALVELYRVEAKDTVMVISNSGRNAVPVEMCLAAKAKGARVIAMTSMQHSANCTSRHSSGKKMYEIADVTIDNWGEPGDAAFPIEGLDTCIGPTSSITGITIAQALVCQVVDNLVRAGIEPPVFKSSNVDGGDEHNNRMFDKYYGYWK